MGTDLLLVVLGDVPGPGFVAPFGGPLVGLNLSHDDFEKRRFSDAVRTNDRDALAALDFEVDVVQYHIVVERLADCFEFEDLFSAGPIQPEIELWIAAGTLREGFEFNSVDCFEFALGLPCFRSFGAEAFNEGLVVCDL